MFVTPLIDIVMGFSSAIELISPQMSNHHKRVAYIAYSIADEMKLDDEEKKQILIAGLLHDSGALHGKEHLNTFEFDFGKMTPERHAHGYRGWLLFRNSEDLQYAAEIIKFHHIYWEECCSEYLEGYDIPLGSHIIHLADRIDILINRNESILKQRNSVVNMIKQNSGHMFMPAAVEAFINISSKEYLWFDLITPFIDDILRNYMVSDKAAINLEKLTSLVSVVYQIIDFRSNFTATHSIGVAESAKALASKFNFSDTDLQLIYLAGLLHDLGKLAVPIEILEKKGPLDTNEFNIVKRHTFYSYRIIERMLKIEKINHWASYHHEKMDGSGYPFKLGEKDLDIGSRIMGVSDVFTALTEHRPYRSAISIDEAMTIMSKMVADKHIDGDVFATLKRNVNEIDYLKTGVQNIALKRHCGFKNYKSFKFPIVGKGLIDEFNAG